MMQLRQKLAKQIIDYPRMAFRQLFVFRGFAHDSQRVLAAIYRLAFVRVELRLHVRPFELSIAPFAYADGWRSSLHDPQVALCHNPSLAHLARGE